jgi:hypothetical protein
LRIARRLADGAQHLQARAVFAFSKTRHGDLGAPRVRSLAYGSPRRARLNVAHREQRCKEDRHANRQPDRIVTGHLHAAGEGPDPRAPFLRRFTRARRARRQPDGKFVYRCGGTELALFPRPEGTKAEHTALSFRVDNIAQAVRTLQQRGVKFAEYDLPGLKTVDHVCVLGSEKAAWFEDPEGNILCLHEDLA